MLQAENITKSYGDLPVLKGVSLHIDKAQVVAIVGPSGAGKSTLLQILGTLDKPDAGSITMNGESLLQLSTKKLAAWRNQNMGFVFQFHNLLPEFTALENVCIPAFIKGSKEEAAQQKAKEILDLLGLADRIHHKPGAMSGGEQQRVAVARALINSPSIIFADEPSGNLDSANATALHELFFKLRDDLGQTFVIVTHNPSLAQMADKTLTMKDGLIL